ncbi:MAG: DUF2225 domain-containing protein [Spirochaetes bacterium]|nr:DUF2225 domain-containing protein [Spirochaetota bacterium]
MSDVQKFIPKLTFLSKKPIICPVCQQEFYHENMMSGGGRLIAEDISDKLHRNYKPSQKFGKVYPLIYPVVVCPDCFYASLPGDFDKIEEDMAATLKMKTQERIDFANRLIGGVIDFSRYRTLESGAVSYVLAAECYDSFNPKMLPVIKQAICSIRGAYLFEDLNKEKPNHYFDYLTEMFYKKALFFYQHAVDLNQNKQQIMENMKTFGPDLDKNYGYDGITYLIAVLTYQYKPKEDPEIRRADLEESKLLFGKLFGMGKSNVDKPKEILDKSRDFYEMINQELKAQNA